MEPNTEVAAHGEQPGDSTAIIITNESLPITIAPNRLRLEAWHEQKTARCLAFGAHQVPVDKRMETESHNTHDAL